MKQTAHHIKNENMLWLSRMMRDYRQQLYMSQIDLAECLGFSQAVISRLENGRANPTYWTLMKMARLIEKKIDFV